MSAPPASPSVPYIGRFAPAPTGPLHFGSAVAAIASFLQARTHRGRWLVRIEDLDTPRNVPGMDRLILEALSVLGLEWDGTVVYQSRRRRAYTAALRRLREQGLLFPCACTRRETAGGPYPGTCRGGLPESRTGRALRVIVPETEVRLADAVQGSVGQRLAAEVGDFIVRRADGQDAYHLAIVVDDAWQGVSEVVRGADLLASTPRQVYLQRALGLATPGYAHIPVALDAAGRKLSKQNHAPALHLDDPAAIWLSALRFLGQNPPPELGRAPAADLLDWAVGNWSLARVPRALKNSAAQAARGSVHAPT